MAVQFAPAPEGINPLILAQLLGRGGSSGDQNNDIALAVQKAYLGQLLPGVGDTSPVQSPWQGVARMGNGLMSGLIAQKLIAGDQANNAKMNSAIGGMLGGGDASPAPAAPSPQMNQMSAAPDAGAAMAQAPGGGMNPGLQGLVKALMNPAPLADTPSPFSGGNPAQGIDRSRIKSELDANPDLMKRYADMVNGETGYRDPKLAQIQAETAADRALTRNIPLAQALMAVNDPNARQGGKNLGYYASDTYNRPAGPQQTAQFQNDILPKVLGGSELGKDTLGFRPTGNASGNFALNRQGNGVYDNAAWYSGQPGRGEMYATEKGDSARMAKNLRSNFPAELLNPNMDPGSAQQFAPTQVAGDNIVPQPPQTPATGQFTPGALPNVQNLAVRPTGPGDGPQAQQRPQAMPQQMPQQAQAQQQQFAQPQRATPQIPPNVSQMARGFLATGTKEGRDNALKILAPYMQPQQYQFKDTADGTMLRMNPATGSAEPIYSAPLKPELKDAGSDPITGQKSFMIWDPKSQTMRPATGQGGAPTGQQSGLLAPGVTEFNHNLTGDDYLNQFGPEVRSAVKAYINGDVMPTGNPRIQSIAQAAKTIAQKYGADMGIPVSDSLYSQRRTYRGQLGSNTPNSAGGQAKAFNQGIEHMDALATTLEKLDNSNGLGIPIVADAMNWARQGVSTQQSAISDKAKGIGQTLAGEVGKLFSGTAGGGVHERALTMERFSTVKSSAQLGAALEATLEVMRGGLTALEQRRDEVLGPKNDVRFVTPETENKMARIQQVIDRLKGGGQQPQQSAPAPQGGLPQDWSVKEVH